MDDVLDKTEEALDENPDLVEPLEEILSIDEKHETWTFNDLSLDSGTFGEIASYNIIDKTEEDEYQLVDQEAVRAALYEETPDESSTREFEFITRIQHATDSRRIAAVAVALAFVALVRVVPIRSVFKGGDVVLLGNDPYKRRFWVETLLSLADGPVDLQMLANLPGPIVADDPLFHVTLWFVVELFGSTAALSGWILAWYPVVAAVLTGLVVYIISVRLTNDSRVGLAAIGLLAITPIYVTRTTLGYADRHVLDYLWLSIVVLLLVLLADDAERSLDRDTGFLVGGLSIAITFQTLNWDGSPLFLFPIVLYLPLLGLLAVRSNERPARLLGPPTVGLGLAAVFAGAIHVLFGWYDVFIPSIPLVLFVGALGVTILSETAQRVGLSVKTLLGIELLGFILATGLVASVPVFSERLDKGITYFADLQGGQIAETHSLFSGAQGSIVAPLFWFGFVLFLALPYMGVIAWHIYKQNDFEWVALAVYSWYLLVLSVVQIRFSGALAIFTAIFGGLAFVRLAAWVDIVETLSVTRKDDSSEPQELEIPDRRTFLHLGALALPVGGFGFMQSVLQQNDLKYNSNQVAAMRWMRSYAAERNWSYPEGYVFSSWDTNRFYNYMVNGIDGYAYSYQYALKHYSDFLSASDGSRYYRIIRNRPDRPSAKSTFIVTHFPDVSDSGDISEDVMFSQLHDYYGVRTNHYRFQWASDGHSLKVFTLVPGATVTGPAEPGSTLNITVQLPNIEPSETVTREVAVNDEGIYSFTLPQPSEFKIVDSEVTVTEQDVVNGAIVSQFEGEGSVYWSFEESDGNIAYDRVGGFHGRLFEDANRLDGIVGSALQVNGDGYMKTNVDVTTPFTLSLWVKPRYEYPLEGNRVLLAADGESILIVNPTGNVAVMHETGMYDIGATLDVDLWTNIVLTSDGQKLQSYVNGEQMTTKTGENATVRLGPGLRIGSTENTDGFAGRIDEVRLYDFVLDAERIKSRYEAISGES